MPGRECRDKKSVVLLHNALLQLVQCAATVRFVARFASAQLLYLFCTYYVKQFNNTCMQHCGIFRERLCFRHVVKRSVMQLTTAH